MVGGGSTQKRKGKYSTLPGFVGIRIFMLNIACQYLLILKTYNLENHIGSEFGLDMITIQVGQVQSVHY